MRFQKRILLPGLISALFLAAGIGAAVGGEEAEQEMARSWSRLLRLEGAPEKPAGKTALLFPATAPPFSFLYGSENSAGLLPGWKKSTRARPLEGRSAEEITTYSDPRTGLEARVEATIYQDFPAVEWVLRFKNTGAGESPVLEKILPLDARLAAPEEAGRKPVLHYARGALCCLDDFAPVDRELEPLARIHLQPGGGRSSSEVLPFFNVEWGPAGTVLGIGWTGEWAAEFSRRADGQIELQAGMAATRLKLRPGEEIRTPRLLALFWQGERWRGNNLLRRFLLAHRRPGPGGRPLVLPVLIGAWGGESAADHMKRIRRIVENQLPVALYWIDAEWFARAPWWKSPGDWTVRKDLYPEGLKPIGELLHSSGRRFLLWFEPQRVCGGTPWSEFKDRPGWLLELKGGNPAYRQRNMNWGVPHEDPRWIEWESRRSQITEGDRLWNLGDAEARRYLTDFLSARIEEFGLDWYREDFNIAPLEYWQGADSPDRVGLTEIRYVEGLYQMWDELLRRHPHLAIDNCASGGRRIDLETIGRSTALWRTDWPADSLHKQCHTYGLLSWVPLHMSGGAALKKGNEYEIRSSMTAGLNVELPPQDDPDSIREAKRLLEQYLAIQKFYYGDYYPLTPYSQSQEAWMAYQLHLPEAGEGLVVVLKRPKSASAGQVFRLQALVEKTRYQVADLDAGRSETLPGARLAKDGLEVKLARRPDSALILYRSIKE